MLRMDNLLIWVVIGTLTAFVFLKSLEWSVNKIHPKNEKKSMGLIIGGIILRWMLIIAVLVFSLSHSTSAALIVFCVFMILRLIYILKWHGWMHASH